MRHVLLLCLALLLTGPAAAQEEGESGVFDFYVLALTWSPGYCASAEPGESPLQCGSGRPFAFVLHGLWPQYERGYPVNCPDLHAPLPASLVRDQLDITPSEGLVRHEWRKHGTCTGLTPEAYFDLAREAYDSIEIPKRYHALETYLGTTPRAIEEAFISANPALDPDGVSIRCKRRDLIEVRVCLTKALQPRACDELEARQCRRDQVVMPPVR